ncbi:hypothetical protein MMC12_002570 [Toensbergia leucococca]|nr:hypothetical protein [Toensbergia leucococca]
MNIRYAKRRDVIRIEEISHLNGGDSLLEWCLAYEDLDFVRDYTRMVYHHIVGCPQHIAIVAEVDSSNPGMRADADRGENGKVIVGFAFWERWGISDKCRSWNERAMPKPSKEEELLNAKFSAATHRLQQDDPFAIKRLNAVTNTIKKTQHSCLNSHISSEWFIVVCIDVHPKWTDKGVEKCLLQFGLNQAKKEEAGCGAFVRGVLANFLRNEKFVQMTKFSLKTPEQGDLGGLTRHFLIDRRLFLE